MPVQYEGVIAEHTAVRSGVGVFDVSHLGRFAVRGPGATSLLRDQLCNDIASVEPGRAQYTMALNAGGGIVDDIIVWRFEDDSYWVMPNGTNFEGILKRFRAGAPDGVDVAPIRGDTVLLAVQGPDAPALVEGVLGFVPGRFRVISGDEDGSAVWAAGTGYTGEKGCEIAVPATAGGPLLQRIVEAGAVPCGLGARDTLRLEMGYPLWGQELDEDTTPLEAGLEWVVNWDHDFVGRGPLERQRNDGVGKELVAFRTEGRAIPRHDYELRMGDSRGRVTSGNFSPTLGYGIGMGYVAPAPAIGGASVQIRGRWVEATPVKPPFVEK